MNRIQLTTACAATAIVAAMPCYAADLEREIDFNIPAQKLDLALVEFSRQAQVQVITAGDDLQNLQTEGARGRLKISHALGALLRNSGLVFKPVGESAVSIGRSVERRTDAAMEPAHPSGRQDGNESIRLSQADTSSGGRAAQGELAAESSQAGSARIEEIIVTAQKREQRLQDVPISISVLSGQQLDRSTVQGATEALTRVPGVAASVGFQGGGTLLNIRGVGAVGAIGAGSSPVAYYLDSVPFGFVKHAMAPDVNAYDLDRVEVLRGPQGTLYGASAQNGVVRVLTRDADLEQFEFKARTSAAQTEHGSESYRGDFAISAPIIEGKLGARAVVGYQKLGGWVDKPGHKDANDGEVRNMRLKVNAQPNDALSIGVSAWVSRSDFDAPSAGFEDFRNSLVDESMSTDFDAYGVKVGYDFGGFSVTSMTSYISFVNDGYLDLAIATNISGLRLRTKLEDEMFAEEILVNSNLDGPWRWSIGGMYRDSQDHLYQRHQLFITDQVWDDQSESYAAFGELTRLLADGRLELTAGVRYFEDRVELQERSRANNPAAQLIRSDRKFDAVSPRGVLTWHPNDQTSVYASYSEGFRSGSHQNPTVQASFPGIPAPHPDNLKNYEVGAKGSLLNGRLVFDAAAYYIDWVDVQQEISVNVGPGRFQNALVNGESASGAGFEIGLSAQPADGLTVGINYSWNDLAFDTDVVSNGIVLFDKGDRPAQSPKATAGAYADYDFPLGGAGYEGRISASANYTSELSNRMIVSGVSRVADNDALLVGRTELAVISPKSWTVSLFVDNITNEDGVVTSNPGLGPDYRQYDTHIRPRTIGLQFEYKL